MSKKMKQIKCGKVTENVSLSGVKHTCKQTKIKPLGSKNVKMVKRSFLDKKIVY